MNACSFINRLMSRIPEAQRTKYLELRSANPQLRMRSDVNLGPRVSVNVKNRERSSLERPEEYFCRLDVYLRDNPGKTVKESEKVWEFLGWRLDRRGSLVETKVHYACQGSGS